ncbi:MAG: DUF5103 domain-containing protein [Bacteroidetes bacterium]|nr:DUF5103 domain-containing protein [Bacteroidota bacterium]
MTNISSFTLFLGFLIVSLCPPCFADELPNENICYDPSIKTIQVFQEGIDLSPAILQLNSTDRLTIQFDDLDPYIKRYKYTILHCESDWKTSSELSVSDYIEGYREENIDRYEYSYNTTVKFTHFKTTFPTDYMKPKLSGNYLLVVYEDDPSILAFTRRFMVVEASPVVAIGKTVQSSQVSERNSRQQIDLIVQLNGFQIQDVGREMKIILMQNGRWDNVLQLSKPRFARTDELDYRYDESISFNGGNQFRSFDIKSLQYQSERIARIAYDTTNQVYLLADQPRTFKQYSFEKELNGRFFIKNEDHAENSNTEADYAWVHFFLPYPVLTTTGTFHILGELTSWQLDERSRMYFNPEHKGYELNLFLKQGYYNYMYVFKEKGKKPGDESLIEGSHWETENDYTVFVYYHEAGSLYDRLLAVNTFNSIQP